MKINKMRGELVSKSNIPLNIYGKAYLSGPIAYVSKNDSIEWREHTKKRLVGEGWLRGCIDPTVRRCVVPWLEYDYIVSKDLSEIDESDILIVNLHYMGTGTPMEVIYAQKHGKLVLTAMPDKILSPWAIFYSDFVFNDIDTLLDDFIPLLKYGYSMNKIKQRYLLKKLNRTEVYRDMRQRFMV
jgi:nucleoside 2-deoxyribosyltransferase